MRTLPSQVAFRVEGDRTGMNRLVDIAEVEGVYKNLHPLQHHRPPVDDVFVKLAPIVVVDNFGKLVNWNTCGQDSERIIRTLPSCHNVEAIDN